MNRLVKALLLAAVAGLPAAARAEVKPHALFSDHMVLQRDAELKVWGTADPGEKVSVTLAGGDGPAVVAETTADEKRRWAVALPKQPAGTGRTLTVKGTNAVTLRDVAVGDVWVCGGQSNMQWEFWRLTKDDQGKKVSAAADNPNLRLFTVARRASPAPLPDLDRGTPDRGRPKAVYGAWQECKPEAVLEFSAVGYYFGREIEKAQKVPVGLLACNWGGTPAEAWTSKEALEAVPALAHYPKALAERMASFDPAKAKAAHAAAVAKWQDAAAKARAEGKPVPQRPAEPAAFNQNSPTTLYNGMLYAILPFAVKGAIWYQGESNASRAAEYYTLYPTMIRDWRRGFGRELPFFASQLAPFRGVQGSNGVDYAEVRDALFQATKALPQVGVAVITDAGDETDIHPQQKEPVGVRLALAARAIAYGEAVEYSGPVYKGHTVEGDKVAVSFDHLGGGLVCRGSELTGFAVCGEDRTFHPAKAEIKGDSVVVRSEAVAKPVAVRFGWVNFAKPELNFFNKAGLPAVPFRTDDFPLTTAAKK